jgi:hypothetical protein
MVREDTNHGEQRREVKIHAQGESLISFLNLHLRNQLLDPGKG